MTSAAIVHDVLKPAGTFPISSICRAGRTPMWRSISICGGAMWRAPWRRPITMFEHTFRTQQVLHLPLEPFVSVAEASGGIEDGRLTIHTASQSPSFVRIEIARLLGWPENRVRVRVPYLGGGFGAKLYIKLEALVAALALLVRRPVKISLTMEEQFYTLTKHASTFRIKSGIKDGRITARQCEVWWNGGAYADIGPRITQKSGFTAPGPYDIDNVAATGAEVEVDTETGQVQVTRLATSPTSAARSIRASSRPSSPAPPSCSSASPCRRRSNSTAGRSSTPRSPTTRIPSILDIPPDMHSEVVEAEQHSGPFGAKGVGESGTFGVSPAIANAIDDAVGVRLTSLPLTAETLYRALRAARNDPLGDER